MIDDTETPISIISPAIFILAEVCVKELSYWHCVSLLKPVNRFIMNWNVHINVIHTSLH